jgi:hypothetical protein
LYFSPIIIGMINSRKMRWAEHVARMGRGEMHIEEKRPLGRPRRRRKDNIEMDFRAIG